MSRYQLDTATQVPAASRNAGRVTRRGAELFLGNSTFHAIGVNAYWLGLDENVDPSPSYPSKSRVLEAYAIAAAMGGTTVRSQTLGISYGTSLSIEKALNTFKPEGEPAWDALDFAVFAARSYGLKLILPLTDQYDYYHGGIPTFLRWRNLSATDYSPFYNLSSQVYADFELYIMTLLNHTSPYTNLTLASDPTILAFETGNELGGWTGSHYAPPVEWTRSIARLLKRLSPDALVISGSYGVKRAELSIAEVDLVSDHYYPPSLRRLANSAEAAASSNSDPKAFLVGEYDWTNKAYESWRFAWFILLLPVAVALLLVFATPSRWWPRRTTLRRLFTCGHIPGGRFASVRRVGELPSTDGRESPAVSLTSPNKDISTSSDRLPILDRASSYPPPGSVRQPRQARFLDRPLAIKRWHLAPIPFLVFLPILIPLLIVYLPSAITPFLSRLSVDENAPGGSPRVAGDLWWSLFGRNDACTAYVQHNDGYTLHYPAFPSNSSSSGETFSTDGSGSGVLELMRHAWTVRDETPFWLSDPSSGISWNTLPTISCPQSPLRWPNGSAIQ